VRNASRNRWPFIHIALSSLPCLAVERGLWSMLTEKGVSYRASVSLPSLLYDASLVYCRHRALSHGGG
jgi:hypothetical protein